MAEDRRASLPHSFLNTDSSIATRASVITTVTEAEAREREAEFTIVVEEHSDEYADDYILPATTYGQPVPEVHIDEYSDDYMLPATTFGLPVREAMYVPIGLDVFSPPETPTRSSFSSLMSSFQLPVIPRIPAFSPIVMSFGIEIAV